MSKNYISAAEAEHYAPAVFELCDLFEQDTLRTRVDLDDQCYGAVKALAAGEPLEAVLAHIKDETRGGRRAVHPAAVHVRAELQQLYARLGGGDTLLRA